MARATTNYDTHTASTTSADGVIRPAIVCFLALTLITGVAYPLVVTGIARVAFKEAASGSMIERGGTPVGSSLIGQNFTGSGYFWPRPSAAGATGYDGASGSGSNLGPSSPSLRDAVAARVEVLQKAHPDRAGKPIPVDLVTSSGSGLDPHLSPEAIEYQLSRVARARHLPESDLRAVVARHTKVRTLGLLGEPTVNVLELNLALDRPIVRGGTKSTASSTTMGVRWQGFVPDAD